MKIVLSIVVIVCSVMIGLCMRKGLAVRCALLENICGFCREAGAAISYEHLAPDRIVERSANSAGFISICASYIAQGGSFKDAWSEALSGCDELYHLKRDEREHLLELGMKLGSSDLSGELDRLSAALEYFSSIKASADVELKQKSKVYISCSAMCGMMLLLLVI